MSKKVTKIPHAELLYIDKVIDYSPLALAALTPRSRTELNSVACKWKYSFTLCTINRKYTMYARSEEEQFLWLSAFYRILGVEVVDASYQISSTTRDFYKSNQHGVKLLKVRKEDNIRLQQNSDRDTDRETILNPSGDKT